MLWWGHMLMILARLVCSESFWVVVKVRSPHTGPEVSYPRTGLDRHCVLYPAVYTRRHHRYYRWLRPRRRRPLARAASPRPTSFCQVTVDGYFRGFVAF